MVYQGYVQRVTWPGHHQRTGKAGIIGASPKPEGPQVSFRVANMESVIVLICGCGRNELAATAQDGPETHCPSSHKELSSSYIRPLHHCLPTLSSNTRRPRRNHHPPSCRYANFTTTDAQARVQELARKDEEPIRQPRITATLGSVYADNASVHNGPGVSIVLPTRYAAKTDTALGSRRSVLKTCSCTTRREPPARWNF